MKLEDALAAHAEWRLRLRRYVDGGTDTIDAVKLGRDDQCALGAWMYGDGNRLASVPEFLEARRAHAEFHFQAAAVARATAAGNRALATSLMGTGGGFDKASTLIGTALVRLRKALQRRAA